MAGGFGMGGTNSLLTALADAGHWLGGLYAPASWLQRDLTQTPANSCTPSIVRAATSHAADGAVTGIVHIAFAFLLIAAIDQIVVRPASFVLNRFVLKRNHASRDVALPGPVSDSLLAGSWYLLHAIFGFLILACTYKEALGCIAHPYQCSCCCCWGFRRARDGDDRDGSIHLASSLGSLVSSILAAAFLTYRVAFYTASRRDVAVAVAIAALYVGCGVLLPLGQTTALSLAIMFGVEMFVSNSVMWFGSLRLVTPKSQKALSRCLKLWINCPLQILVLYIRFIFVFHASDSTQNLAEQRLGAAEVVASIGISVAVVAQSICEADEATAECQRCSPGMF